MFWGEMLSVESENKDLERVHKIEFWFGSLWVVLIDYENKEHNKMYSHTEIVLLKLRVEETWLHVRVNTPAIIKSFSTPSL